MTRSVEEQEGGIELTSCLEVARKCSPEIAVDELPTWPWRSTVLFLAEGFEERSLGLLEWLAGRGLRAEQVVLGRYGSQPDLNSLHRERYLGLCAQVSEKPYVVRNIDETGDWIREVAEERTGNPDRRIVLDVSGMSGRAIFAALDAMMRCGEGFALAYSEAKTYWPRQGDVQSILGAGATDVDSEDRHALIEDEHWLHGGSHHVDLLPGHEGYDAGTKGVALVGFLPYKSSRLGAVLGWMDYSHRLFIAGVPRLSANGWRRDALLQINSRIIGGARVVDVPTFGYREVLAQVATLLLGSEGLLERHNIHMAVLGSKLQTIGCWLLSRVVPAITMVTSTPATYYNRAFSEGVGMSWLIPCMGWRGFGREGQVL